MTQSSSTIPIKPATQVPTLAFGVVGIGRMGQRHALNLLRLIPNAKLVCACSPAQADLEWAEKELVPYGVQIYSAFEDMIQHEGLQAVIISSLTTLHYKHTVESLQRGIHVLCEKPICQTEDELKQLIALTTANPQTRLMVGFTRRFDASYRAALTHIRTNALGRPTTLRFQSCEPYDASPFMQSYLSRCGGIFFDSVVHDIDLCLMFLGDSKPGEVAVPHKAIAFGHAALHTQLRSPGEHASLSGDADNALGMVQFRSGAIAWFYNSRTAAPGHYDNATEIMCEKGKVSVNLTAARDRLQVADERGASVKLVEGWYERYKEAFVVETREFVEAVLGKKEMGVPIGSVLVGLRIALALQESLRRGGVVVRFDEKGERVLEENEAKL